MLSGRWIAGIALGLTVALGPLAYAVWQANVDPLPRPAASDFETPECRYDDARKAAQEANERAKSKEDGITPAARRERQDAADAAGDREQEAKECEQRAREWSDLHAQWANAVAAENTAAITHRQMYLSLAEIWALFITIVVGIVAIAQARWESERDFKLLKSQADGAVADAAEQADRFKQQLEVAVTAATAAKESADAYRSSERAWLGVLSIQHVPFSGQAGDLAVENGMLFSMNWHNSGKTPAFGVECFSNHLLVDFNDEICPVFPVMEIDDPRSAVVVPGGGFGSPDRALNDAEVADVIAKRKKVILYGRVDYRDAFNPSVTRVTEYCVQCVYNGTARRRDTGAVELNFSMTAVGKQNNST